MNEKKMTNLDAMLDGLDEALNTVTIDSELDEDSNLKLWKGTISCHIIDIYNDEFGYHVVFADKDNNIMPSYFESEKFGSIWAGKTIEGLKNFLRSMKYALRMPSDTPLSLVKKNLETKNYPIYFYAEGKMGKKGMYYRNEINFSETQKGVQ